MATDYYEDPLMSALRGNPMDDMYARGWRPEPKLIDKWNPETSSPMAMQNQFTIPENTQLKPFYVPEGTPPLPNYIPQPQQKPVDIFAPPAQQSQPPPIDGGITRQAPGGGYYTVPQPTQDQIKYNEEVGYDVYGNQVTLAPAQTQRQFADEQARALGFGNAEEAGRAMSQADRMAGFGDRMAVRESQKIINELRSQNMTDDQIRAATGIGTDKISATEAYRRLAELNNSRATDNRNTRDMERITSRARTKERTTGYNPDGSPVKSEMPANREARYIETKNYLDEPARDAEGNVTTNRSFLSKGEQRELERYERGLASGVKGDEGRINRIRKNAEMRRANAETQYKYKQESDQISSQIAKEQSAERKQKLTEWKTAVEAYNTEAVSLQEKLDKLGYSKKQEKERIRNRLQEIDAEKAKIVGDIQKFVQLASTPTNYPIPSQGSIQLLMSKPTEENKRLFKQTYGFIPEGV